MSRSKPRAKVPKLVKSGEVFLIKTLISHIMENGERRGDDGNVVPRRIINRFACAFNGKQFFECEVHPSVSENPFFAFPARISEEGEFVFTWYDDDGSVYALKKKVGLST